MAVKVTETITQHNNTNDNDTRNNNGEADSVNNNNCCDQPGCGAEQAGTGNLIKQSGYQYI